MFDDNDIRVRRADLLFGDVVPSRCSLKADRLALATTWDGIGNKEAADPQWTASGPVTIQSVYKLRPRPIPGGPYTRAVCPVCFDRNFWYSLFFLNSVENLYIKDVCGRADETTWTVTLYINSICVLRKKKKLWNYINTVSKMYYYKITRKLTTKKKWFNVRSVTRVVLIIIGVSSRKNVL